MKKSLLSEPLDDALSTDAINQGYSLIWWSPAALKVDPVILYKHGREVYRWDFVPSMIEVWEKIKSLQNLEPGIVR